MGEWEEQTTKTSILPIRTKEKSREERIIDRGKTGGQRRSTLQDVGFG